MSLASPRETTRNGYPHRKKLFVGFCYLCGQPCARRSLYCVAHKWAAQ